MPPTLLHILGTDTGVGKTAIACAVVRALRERGRPVGVCKPFASGAAGGTLPEDARLLMDAAGGKPDPDVVSPVRFAMPAAPVTAARAEGRSVDVEMACAAVSTLLAKHDIVVVEGIGGVMVPLAPGVLYVDFMAKLARKTRVETTGLIVARTQLGTLNHSLLTIEVLQRRGLPVAGVVLNQSTAGSGDPTETTNGAVIEEFGKVPVLGTIPYQEDGPGRVPLPRDILKGLLS